MIIQSNDLGIVDGKILRDKSISLEIKAVYAYISLYKDSGEDVDVLQTARELNITMEDLNKYLDVLYKDLKVIEL